MKAIINLYKQNSCFSKNITTDNIKLIMSKNNIKKVIYLCLKNVFSAKRISEIKCIILDINFVDKNTIMYYNHKFRGIDNVTNVLSFANNVFTKNGHDINNNISILALGEILMCCDKILEESQEYHKTFMERYMHILIHSILHLLGYDHIDNQERLQMERLEGQILSQLGIYHPYSMD